MQLHFYLLYIGFTRSKNSYNDMLCNIWGKQDSARYRELSFFDFLWKKDSSKAMNSQLRAPGSKPTRYARLCSAHFEESCFEVEMFSSTNGS